MLSSMINVNVDIDRSALWAIAQRIDPTQLALGAGNSCLKAF
jgi:hypothetical protein